MIEFISTVVLILFLAFIVDIIMWLVNKLRSPRCPECDSLFSCEYFGSWEHTDEWKCHACEHYWSVKSN